MYCPGEIDLFVSGPVFFGILREEIIEFREGKKNLKKSWTRWSFKIKTTVCYY